MKITHGGIEAEKVRSGGFRPTLRPPEADAAGRRGSWQGVHPATTTKICVFSVIDRL